MHAGERSDQRGRRRTRNGEHTFRGGETDLGDNWGVGEEGCSDADKLFLAVSAFDVFTDELIQVFG